MARQKDRNIHDVRAERVIRGERYILRFLTAIIFVSLSVLLIACSGNTSSSQLKGVAIADDGETYVTFALPDGKTLEEVIGSDVPEENGLAITTMGGSGTSVAYWSHVGSGGLVVWYGHTCRYSPTATTTTVAGKASPPGYLILNGAIDDADIFDPKDVDALATRYGIKLNL